MNKAVKETLEDMTTKQLYKIKNPQIRVSFQELTFQSTSTILLQQEDADKKDYDFNQEFSFKIRGKNSLNDIVTILLMDGDKIIGESKIKIKTLLNGGEVKSPITINNVDDLKKRICEKQ